VTEKNLYARNLKTLSGVRHAFFTRSWGNEYFSETQTGEGIMPARGRIAAHLGVAPEQFLCCRQIHSPIVVTVGHVWKSQNAPEADAMVTNKSGIALGILTADCAPVLFADSKISVIGAAHAGWRGALGGVIERTLEAMEKLGAQRKHIHAALGPCIGQKSYEVGSEFPAPFIAETPSNERFFKPSTRSGYYQFDLQGYIEIKMRDLDIDSVESSSLDTCEDPNLFFSHRYSTLRGEKRKGSLVSAISLA
jgi:polyphenol oxidase